MSRPLNALIVAMIAVTTPALCHAQGPLSDYKCVIERVESANDDADVVSLYRSLVAQVFTVERQTGVMAGALKNNYVTEPYVVDVGSEENSYKVVTTMRRDQGAGAGSNVYVLTIDEYVESARKPFLFAHNDVVFFGYCEHF